MSWVLTALGVVLVLLVLLDVFHTLWHPSTSGMLSAYLGRGLWRLSHAGGRDPRPTVGPWTLVAVLAAWGALVVLGYALVYWPGMDSQFSFSSGLEPAARSDVADAVYLSLVTFATLGYGDIVPAQSWLRFVAPTQALVGFVVLSASITWVLQIYPALGRRRALALQLKSLGQQSAVREVPQLDSSAAAGLLADLAASTGQVRIDLTQYPHTYYFWDDVVTSLPAWIWQAWELAESGSRSPRADVRFAAGLLSSSLEDLAVLLGKEFLGQEGDTGAVLKAYRQDHHGGRT